MLVCILIYLHGSEQAVFQKAAYVLCSFLFFVFFKFQVEIITNVNSPYLKLFGFYFLFFTLENSPSKSGLWFSESVMLVRPLNGMLITN